MSALRASRIPVWVTLFSLLLNLPCAFAQSLDACDLDLDLLDVVRDECDPVERSAGWARFGFDPAGAGLLTGGSLSGSIAVVPGSSSEIRIARLQPTQPVVWLVPQETRATAIQDEWLDVVLVRESPASWRIAIVRWVMQGLSASATTLAQSGTIDETGPLNLSIGWNYSSGVVTVSVSGIGANPLTATRSGFGDALPWLSLPHFPSPTADFQSASIGGISGSAQ